MQKSKKWIKATLILPACLGAFMALKLAAGAKNGPRLCYEKFKEASREMRNTSHAAAACGGEKEAHLFGSGTEWRRDMLADIWIAP